jgi:CelD/BcsL family acetyltransferase involved in cellulose biosynthesis
MMLSEASAIFSATKAEWSGLGHGRKTDSVDTMRQGFDWAESARSCGMVDTLPPLATFLVINRKNRTA